MVIFGFAVLNQKTAYPSNIEAFSIFSAMEGVVKMQPPCGNNDGNHNICGILGLSNACSFNCLWVLSFAK
jgi:hypothetical protein